MRLRPPGGAAIHRTVSGIGDTRFWGEYAWKPNDDWTLSGGLGLKAPTGDPERPQTPGGVPSSTLQTGTGTWDPFLRFAASRRFGDVDGFVTLDATVPLMENHFEYRPAASTRLTLGAEVPVEEWFRVVPSIHYDYRDADRFRGNDLFASGGHWLYGGVLLEFRVDDAVALWAGAEAPLLRDLDTPTLESDVRGTAGVSLSF